MEILEDLKKTINLDYGVKLHPRYVKGVHEEQFGKDKKEIESIYGVKFPQDFYDSFFVLNGIYNFDGLSLFSLDAIEEDNNNYVDTFGNSEQNYILVGKNSYDFLVYDIDNKGFGSLSFSEWTNGVEIGVVEKSYESFLNDIISSYINPNLGEIEEI